jgi:uncharacterized protein (TIRG00374 family)
MQKNAEPEKLLWLDWRVLPPLAASIAIIWFLVVKLAGFDDMATTLRGARWELAPLLLPLMIVQTLVATNRWRWIVQTMGYDLGLREALKAVLAAWPFALLTPTRAGELVRVLSIRKIVPPMVGVGTIIVEKVIDVQILCVIAVVGSLITGWWQWGAVALGVLAASWASLALLVRAEAMARRIPVLKRLAPKAGQLILAFQAFVREPGRFALAALASVLTWIGAIVLIQLLLVIAGAGVQFTRTFALWPLAVFAGVLPVTLAGVGTRDAAFLYLLNATGPSDAMDDAAVVAATLGYAVVGTWLLGLAGIPFALRLSLTLGRERRNARDTRAV